MMNRRVHSKVVKASALERLKDRGVTLEGIAEIVYQMQSPYSKNLTMESCLESVAAVLDKREIQHAILVGVELDQLAERNQLSEPLLSIVREDEGDRKSVV